MNPPFGTMRSEDEIQRAHDILNLAITGGLPGIPIRGEIGIRLRFALDAICWVLRHEHEEGFHKNLAEIESWAADHGYRLIPIGGGAEGLQ